MNRCRDIPVSSVDEPGAKRQRRCSKCRKTGHRITNCPELAVNESEDDESRLVASSVSHDDENLRAVDEDDDDNSSVRSNEQDADSFDSDDDSIDEGTEHEIAGLLLSLNDDGK